ncbi:MAG: chromosome partitioning protein ParB, partial [Candidatus Omnitrophica bacterium]|nr:chromosome partitioning protein ParB [Candidatus Omnitrophota bacterium]
KRGPEVQQWVRSGQLSTGHAKAILGMENADAQRMTAEFVIREGLNVRQTEEWVLRWQQRHAAGADSEKPKPAGTPVRDAQVLDLENRLQQRFGTKVQLRYNRGKGTVVIHFFNEDDLSRLLELFSVKVD